METRISTDYITELKENEIFVFGSNLEGMHGGGAARAAYNKFGAIWGQGVGLQGQSYGIPTMHGGVDVIKPYVDEFIDFAKSHTELKFLVTRIGCGIAGFRDEEMAPLFKDAIEIENIYLPKSFYNILVKQTDLLIKQSNKKVLKMSRVYKNPKQQDVVYKFIGDVNFCSEIWVEL